MHSLFHSRFNRTALLILPPNCKYIHFDERNRKPHGKYWNKSHFSYNKSSCLKKWFSELCMGREICRSWIPISLHPLCFLKVVTSKFNCLKKTQRNLQKAYKKYLDFFWPLTNNHHRGKCFIFHYIHVQREPPAGLHRRIRSQHEDQVHTEPSQAIQWVQVLWPLAISLSSHLCQIGGKTARIAMRTRKKSKVSSWQESRSKKRLSE